ncbi:hypothetical protein AURDEDRAFT_21050, partial [Auricularia subglabra TFB-10046 SS5]
RGLSFARTIQRQAAEFLRAGMLPPKMQGKGAAHVSLLDRPDIAAGISDWATAQGVSPTRLRRFLNQDLLPRIAPGSKVSYKAASKRLRKMGYAKETYKKGVYVDGHERADNILYRQEGLSIKYDDKTGEPLPLTLPTAEQRRHIFFHDECCFNANDREKTIWLKPGEQQLRQKGRGRAVHVSEFIYEAGGVLRLTADERRKQELLPEDQRLKANESRVIMYPGKGRDGWWDMPKLFAQVVDTIDLFEFKHPGDKMVIVFDQAKAHAAFADDALVASRMQVGSGIKQPQMRDTTIPDDNPNPALRGTTQRMVFDDGTPKGMKVVLQERGLYDRIKPGARGQPVGKCKSCSTSEAKRTEMEKRAREALEADPELYGSFAAEVPAAAETDSWCCMLRCLSQQKDFREEKPKIQKYIEARGHFCAFLPKFHCELNPIELMWANGKQKFRDEADGTFETAKKLVPRCLDAIPPTRIRHFFRKVYRYMDAYRKGLDAKQTAYAVKKYKSHRSVPAGIMMDVNII